MDPEANLKEQYSIATDIVAIWDEADDHGGLPTEQIEQAADLASRLAELVIALAQWNAKK